MKNKTYHAGANDERTAIIAKIRREQAAGIIDPGLLLQWLLRRDTRYKRRTGGL